MSLNEDSLAKLQRLQNSLADEVTEYDPIDESFTQKTQDLKKLITSKVSSYRSAKLTKARAQFEHNAKQFQNLGSVYGGSFNQKKLFLKELLLRKPEYRENLTLAFRDEEEINESDLDNLLQDLKRLGVIDSELDSPQ